MKRVVFAAVAVCLAAAPAFAASPKIDAAVKTFKAVSADPAKLKIFCDMSKAHGRGRREGRRRQRMPRSTAS